jgi:hypothetical protein
MDHAFPLPIQQTSLGIAIRGQPHKRMISHHPFKPEEDARLIQIMTTMPFLSWDSVAGNFTDRTARQCRERWLNYLCPQVRTGPWTNEEDVMLIAMLNQHGRSWSLIRRLFNGRSENDIKNRWYSHLQFETVLMRGRLTLAQGRGCGGGRTERQKRQRAVCDPKGTALRLLENRLPPQPPVSSSKVYTQSDSAAGVPHETVDFRTIEAGLDWGEGGDSFGGFPAGEFWDSY